MPIGHILLAIPTGKSMPLSTWAPNHSECAFPIAEIDLVTGGDIKELNFLKNFLFFPSVTLLIQLGSQKKGNCSSTLFPFLFCARSASLQLHLGHFLIPELNFRSQRWRPCSAFSCSTHSHQAQSGS